jgi:hypothetical protein
MKVVALCPELTPTIVARSPTTRHWMRSQRFGTKPRAHSSQASMVCPTQPTTSSDAQQHRHPGPQLQAPPCSWSVGWCRSRRSALRRDAFDRNGGSGWPPGARVAAGRSRGRRTKGSLQRKRTQQRWSSRLREWTAGSSHQARLCIVRGVMSAAPTLEAV